MLQPNKMIQPTKPVEVKEFLGINQTKDKYVVGLNGYATDAQNIDTRGGTLKRCKGSTLYNSAVVPAWVETLMVFFKNSTPIILAAGGGNIYKLDGNLFSQIASGFQSSKFDYINFMENDTEVLIFTNGIDPVKIYDGTTIRDLKMNGMASAAGGTNQAPKGSIIELHAERVWLFDKHSAYFSTANDDGIDPEDFTAPTDETEVNQHGGEILLYTNDGTDVLAARTLFEDILIFKAQTVFRIFGDSPDTYRMIQMVHMMDGNIIDRTISASAAGAFWTTTKGIQYYDGMNTMNLTDGIYDTFKTLNKAYINNAVAAIYDNKYILAVPEGTSTVNNLIIEYDIERKLFMLKRGITVASFMEVGDNLLYVDDSGKIYKYDTGETWQGYLPINSYWTTGIDSFGNVNRTKSSSIKKVMASGNGQVRFSIMSEKSTKHKDVTLTAGDKPSKINVKHKGRTLQFKIENIGGSDFKIIEPQITIEG